MFRKRILCVIDSLGPGGAQRQMAGLACFLKETGYDVSVVIYHKDLFYAERLNRSEVPYTYLEKAERGATRFYHMSRFIRKARPDCVIAYLATPCICACLAKIVSHPFKLIVSERNTTQQTGFNEKVRFRLFRLADYVVPNAYAQADYLKNNFPILRDKVVTIPNYVDLDYFRPPLEKNLRNVPEVLVVATIWASKNTLGFVEAVARLKEKGYRFHVSWYGKDQANIEYCNTCQALIEKKGVGDFLELKEKTASIRDCYQDADFFCLPSFYEGTPNAICEALACGLPVACSDVCDNSLYVVEGENGFLFNPKDTDSIVAAFERLFSLRSDDYRVFSKNCRETANRKLSQKGFTDAYIQLIES